MNRKLEMLELDDSDVVVDMRGSGGNGGVGMMGMASGMSMAAMGMSGVNFNSYPQQQHNALDFMDNAAHEVCDCVLRLSLECECGNDGVVCVCVL